MLPYHPRALHSTTPFHKQHRDAEHWESVLTLLNSRVSGLPRLVGFRVDEVAPGRLLASLDIRPSLLAANGYLHAGTVVTLADTACGYGCFANLPPDAKNFATIDMNCQFIGSALEGTIYAEARLRHAGQSTQVWDAEVRTQPPHVEAAKTLALFRCTQMLLDARKPIDPQHSTPHGSGDGRAHAWP